MRKLVQGSVRVFPISIMKKHSPKQNNYFSVSWKARKTKGTQLTKSDMQWGRRHTLMCRFKNFLLHTKINCYTCLTLHTLFIEPWLMNNKQRVYPTEAWKYHFINFWTICLIYTWFCNVYVSFLFFDASHWPRIWHSTIGGRRLAVNMIHASATNMTSVWNKPLENQKFPENVIIGFSTINSAITTKLRSLDYSFII